MPLTEFPPVSGGNKILDDAYLSTSPAECTGVVYMTQKSVYQSAPVKNVATALWQEDGYAPTAIDIAEEVIAVPSAGDADALFARFS